MITKHNTGLYDAVPNVYVYKLVRSYKSIEVPTLIIPCNYTTFCLQCRIGILDRYEELPFMLICVYNVHGKMIVIADKNETIPLAQMSHVVLLRD